MEATSELRNALLRIQTEYVEMPDLKLTARQAQRLWNLSCDVCEAALAVLIGKRFLVQTRDGSYIRGGATRDWGQLRMAAFDEVRGTAAAKDAA